MTDDNNFLIPKYKCIHPRLKEILADLAPPSPVAVPRDSSQPRAGYLLSIHKEGPQTLAEDIPQGDKQEKPEVRLSLDSVLLRRRREK
jgi:hypothetical protein